MDLPRELRQLIQAEVASGRFASPSAVIREGLRLLAEERAWRETVRAQIAEGLAQARAGELRDGEEVFARLSQRIEARRKKPA